MINHLINEGRPIGLRDISDYNAFCLYRFALILVQCSLPILALLKYPVNIFHTITEKRKLLKVIEIIQYYFSQN